MGETHMTESEQRRVVNLDRTFDAPRALVFDAWTDADHLARWWGPEGFSLSSAESDPRPGGTLRLVMRGDDGIDLPMNGVYLEVVVPERLVVKTTALGTDGRPVLEGTFSATFTDQGDRTRIKLRAEATALAPEAIAMLGGMQAGWSQSLQCLDDMFTGAVERQLVVTRMLSAPPAQVFELWTNPDHVSRWWGPTGFSISIEEMDVRPGGTWRFTMHGPDGGDYPNTIVYDTIQAPDRLVFTHQAPRFRTTVTFDEMMGMTVLTMRQVFDSAQEREMVAEKFHAKEGAEQTLARLAALLESTVGAV